MVWYPRQGAITNLFLGIDPWDHAPWAYASKLKKEGGRGPLAREGRSRSCTQLSVCALNSLPSLKVADPSSWRAVSRVQTGLRTQALGLGFH